MPKPLFEIGRQSPRRSILKRGLFGGVLLALGGGGYLFARPSRRVPLPTDGLRVFSENEYAFFHAFADRIVAPRPGTPTTDDVHVAFNADRILSRADEGSRKELKQLIGLFESALTGFLFGARRQPFTQLAAAEQDAVLVEWRDSRLVIRRTGYQALRTLAMAAYYSAPSTWPVVGYPGPPQGFHQPDAPAWRGGAEPRPDGNGVFHEGEQ